MFNKVSSICLLLVFLYSTGEETIHNHLKIALVNLDPFVVKDSNGSESGFLVDLVNELLHRVNTSGTQSVTYETYWLDTDEESSEVDKWDKVRSALLRGDADMGLMPLADTIGWNGLIQLSQPYLPTPFVPLVARKMLETQNGANTTTLDKVLQGQLKGLYVKGSAMGGMIENDYRSPAKDLRESLGQGNESQVPHHHGGVERVQNEPDRLVLFGEALRLERYMLQAKACDLAIDYGSVVGFGTYTLPISLFVQSQPLISSINMNLLAMRQDGTIARLKNKWWHAPLDAACKPAKFDGILNSLENYY